jgi:preprotein translocase subunit SecE
VASRWQGLRESLSQAVTFVQEAWGELRRVHWPSRRETRTATFVVIVVVGVVTVFLFFIDATLSRLLRTFLSN